MIERLCGILEPVKLSNPETLYVLKVMPEWANLYGSGVDAKTIAKKYGVRASTVYRRLREQGVSIRSRSEVKIAALNPMWRSDKVEYGGLHSWVKSRLPKPDLCSNCKARPALDLANASPKYDAFTYTRDLANWRWLCRRCHMLEDGRIHNLNRGGRLRTHEKCTLCPKPHEAHGYCKRHYQQSKRTGRVWV